MFRKFICILVVFTVLLTAGMAVYAAPTVDEPSSQQAANAASDTGDNGGKASDVTSDKSGDKAPVDWQSILDNVIKNGDKNDNGLVSISSPDKDKDFTTRKSYVISGSTEYSDIRIYIAKKSTEDGKYYDKPLLDSDGESHWDVGEAGLFAKEITLDEGRNFIEIVAVRTSKLGDLKAEDIQVSTFTISYMKQSILDKAVGSVKNLLQGVTKNIDNILNKK